MTPDSILALALKRMDLRDELRSKAAQVREEKDE